MRRSLLLISIVLAAAGIAGVASWWANRLPERLRVTSAEFRNRTQVVVTVSGTEVLVDRSMRLARGATAADVLSGAAHVVRTDDGGIAHINGYLARVPGPFGPEPTDWRCRLDGIELAVPLETAKPSPGSSLWCDLSRVDTFPHVPLAVSSFPEPFLRYLPERRLRISYGRGLDNEAQGLEKLFETRDPEVVEVVRHPFLQRHGVTRKTRVPHIAVETGRPAIVIGTWREIRFDMVIADVALHPRRHGLTVWLEGGQVHRQSPNELISAPLPDARGLVFATMVGRPGRQTPLLVVTGRTAADVKRALNALRSGELYLQLAGAFDSKGELIGPTPAPR